MTEFVTSDEINTETLIPIEVVRKTKRINQKVESGTTRTHQQLGWLAGIAARCPIGIGYMETGTQSESGREPPTQSDIGIKATRVSETEGGASRIRGTKSILEEELRLCGCIEDLLGSIEIIHHTNIEVIGKGAFLRIYHMIGISILRHTINRMIDEQSCPARYIIR